jgi:hypothetical protein
MKRWSNQMMRKVLHVAVAALGVLTFIYAAYADSKNPIGWMKTSDIGCGVVEGTEVCNPIDHYTDAYQRGEDCATYGVPFYDRPNGKPIGLLWGEAQIILGEKSNDGKYTRIWSKSDLKDVGIMPYSLKALHECG